MFTPGEKNSQQKEQQGPGSPRGVAERRGSNSRVTLSEWARGKGGTELSGAGRTGERRASPAALGALTVLSGESTWCRLCLKNDSCCCVKRVGDGVGERTNTSAGNSDEGLDARQPWGW